MTMRIDEMKITFDAKFLDGLDIVFSQAKYVALAVILALAVGIFYAISVNLIYVQPIIFLNYYNLLYEGLPNLITGLIFLITVPILASLTMTLLIYKTNQVRNLSAGYKEAGIGGFGLLVGVFTSVCPECVPLFLYYAGVTYGVFTALISPYLIWIRFLAIAVLAVSFYYAAKEVNSICAIKPRRKNRG